MPKTTAVMTSGECPDMLMKRREEVLVADLIEGCEVKSVGNSTKISEDQEQGGTEWSARGCIKIQNAAYFPG